MTRPGVFSVVPRDDDSDDRHAGVVDALPSQRCATTYDHSASGEIAQHAIAAGGASARSTPENDRTAKGPVTAIYIVAISAPQPSKVDRTPQTRRRGLAAMNERRIVQLMRRAHEARGGHVADVSIRNRSRRRGAAKRTAAALIQVARGVHNKEKS